MKATNTRVRSYQPYINIGNNNYWEVFHNIQNNLKKLHRNAVQSQKSDILYVISYDNIKIKLRKLGYKFSNTQFNTSKKKRLSDSFNLKVYKRSAPLSKQKLSEGHKEEFIHF